MTTLKLTLTGDFSELARWQDQLSAAPQHVPLLSKLLAEETIDMIRDGFAESKDPYGRTWEPLKLRAGQPLRDHGGLQSSWHRRFATGQGFVVQSGKEYASYHQTGTGIYGPRGAPIKPKKPGGALKIPTIGGAIFRKSVKGAPARKMVPDRGDVPSGWRERYIEAANEALEEIFK